jgi:hypothetical protein
MPKVCPTYIFQLSLSTVKCLLLCTLQRTSDINLLSLEWDAASSRYSSSRLSEGFDEGYTTVQGSKKKRFNQAQAGPPQNAVDHAATNGNRHNHVARPAAVNGCGKVRAGPSRGRGGGAGRGNAVNDHLKEKPTNHVPQPKRSSTRRPRLLNAAELANQRGEPATGQMSSGSNIDALYLTSNDSRVQLHNSKKDLPSAVWNLHRISTLITANTRLVFRANLGI